MNIGCCGQSSATFAAPGENPHRATDTHAESERPAEKSASGEELTDDQKKQVQELKRRDAEVRAHEQAHAAAGGPYASPPKYEFTTGPDGKRYVVSGEVQIDTAPVKGNPDATIRKMDIVVRAALAPAQPSSQDMAVARDAQQMRQDAQNERLKMKLEEQESGREEELTEIDADDPVIKSALDAYRVNGETGDTPRISITA